jgi:hypothetical protein
MPRGKSRLFCAFCRTGELFLAESSTHPTLVVTGGDLDGTSFIILESSKDMLLGSSSDCDFQILLGNVEAVHAKVRWSSKGLLLSDALSSSGTYVNGEKAGDDHRLTDGDRISLGPPGSKSSCKLLVRIPEGLGFPADDGPADEPFVLVKPEGGLAPVEAEALPAISLDPPEPQAPAAAAVDAAPAPAAAPPPPIPAPNESRRAEKPEYLTEPPSIAGDRAPAPRPPRPASRPPAKPAAPPKKSSRSPVILVLGLLVAVGLFLGARILLRKPPSISSITPPRSEPGQSVTLAGKGFDGTPAQNLVRFGTVPGQVAVASPESLTVTVPPNLAVPPGGELPVVVEVQGQVSAPFTFRVYRAPRVSGVEPDVAMPGEEVVVNGQNLDGKPLTVTVGGMAAEIRESVAASIRIVVPELPVTQGKVVTVNVLIGPDAAKPADLTVGYLPLLTDVKPDQSQAGEKVVIKGRGFDADAEDNEVYFGRQPALILSASTTELTVVAPAAPGFDAQTTNQVHVKANGAVSSAPVRFTHLRPSTTVFVPRFFAAAVLGRPDLAYVSTDLGPLLLMGGPEDQVTATAARAAKAADTLNQLVGAAAAQPPAFELRDKPETAVALAGRDEPVVTVTAEDAAAYELGLETGAKARRPTVRGLATYWTALIQDYFALFVRNQRPVAVLALSARGRVLSELYSAAQRTPGANGVPMRLLNPMPASTARALREMAFVLPAEKESRASVAVEGLWSGALEEAGAGSRPFQVRFQQSGNRLTGTLSTRAGKVDMNIPLRDVTYQKNEVRFVVDLQGATRVFTGAVQGGTISGTIAKGPDKAAGSFSLKYVE